MGDYKKTVHETDQKQKVRTLTPEDILNVCKHTDGVLQGGVPNAMATKLCTINEELTNGISFIKKHPKSVTFFGSARLKETNPHYIQARELAKRIVNELNYAVTTGGGPGIMEAANRGAYEAKGHSLGLTIQLPEIQKSNKYVTECLDFFYFFTRKVVLAYSAECYLYFPGGFGTMDELFEIMTLMQTGKIARRPIVLVGTEFWNPFKKFINETLYDAFGTIGDKDLKLFTITDDNDEIIDVIKKSPVRI